jgi:hypothetical protein
VAIHLGKFRSWEQPHDATPSAIIRQYERGYAGAMYSDEAQEEWIDKCTIKSGEEVCSIMGYEDSAKGQLVTPFLHAVKAYPGCFPGGSQAVGDCVSWGCRNALLVTLCCEAAAGLPDAVSGEVEQVPTASAEAIRFGVLSTEAIYAFRSTKPGHGWYCAEAARVAQVEAGCVLRKPYDGIDLTRYSKQNATAFNRREPSNPLQDAWDDHVVRESTLCSSFEALRDLLARGFGVNTCGSEGFSSTRDENGVCGRKGRWAHAMAYTAVDDRPWAHAKYGCGLVLLQNSWGEYMTGPRKIRDSEHEIPPGSFWAKWTDVRRRSIHVMAAAHGWRRELLPDMLGGFA